MCFDPALISGASGVLGAFAGALASFLVAKVKAKSDHELETKRLQANLIATERLRWLQDIRQRLSTLYQQLDLQYNMLKRPVVSEEQKVTRQQQFDDLFSDITEQKHMITLMLNPQKLAQKDLQTELQEALKFINLAGSRTTQNGIDNSDDCKYIGIKRDAFVAMTRIGIETWKQVKSLK